MFDEGFKHARLNLLSELLNERSCFSMALTAIRRFLDLIPSEWLDRHQKGLIKRLLVVAARFLMLLGVH